MSNHYINRTVNSHSPVANVTGKPVLVAKTKTMNKARAGKTALNRIEGLFKKKATRTVAEISNYLQIESHLVPRQIRRLGEQRGYNVSRTKKKNRSYYTVTAAF